MFDLLFFFYQASYNFFGDGLDFFEQFDTLQPFESMKFCPICSNLLLVELGEQNFRFCCQTCPYISVITKKISKTMKLKRKEVDDVLGGEDAWAAADRTTTACPFCDSMEAFFVQLQIRSADEPMTTFYRCTLCANRWSGD